MGAYIWTSGGGIGVGEPMVQRSESRVGAGLVTTSLSLQPTDQQ